MEFLSSALVADALDALGLRHQVLPAAIVPLRRTMVLAGPALPVQVQATDAIEDPPYRMEMAAVDQVGTGEILFYVCAPNVDAAVFGELFGHAVRARGGAGVVCDGPIRDATQLADAGWPVFASRRSPLDTNGRAQVTTIGAPVSCGGVEVARGDLLVADGDGVVVCPAASIDAVRRAVEAKTAKESGARADLDAGHTLSAVWQRWGAL